MTELQQKLRTDLPGNPRYQPQVLVPYFGYDRLCRFIGEVEVANLQVLGEIDVIPPEDARFLTEEMIAAILDIATTQVDKVEREITKHDIRAWVRCAQEVVALRLHPPELLNRWIHVPLTSYDPIETARVLQLVRAFDGVIKPLTKEVILILAELAERFAHQLQVGRTHGQHALPITVGFWLATILSRIIYNYRKLEEHASQLVGKISGAVGAHNAQICLGLNDRCGGKSYEELVLAKLGLKPARISTQIMPPEPSAYFYFSALMLSASFGQLGRDGRHLMRTEINEIAEGFEPGQVGSSTMAQKRNPINFENLEGMFWRTKNEFGKVLDTVISEHQRDLVGSCVARDFPIIIVNLCQQLSTLLRKNKPGVEFLRCLTVNADACEANLAKSANTILAEPLYIALQMAGYSGDAHELVNRELVPLVNQTGRPLIEVAQLQAASNSELAAALELIPGDVKDLLGQPERYIGDAPAKTMEIVTLARTIV
ncbi:MAG: hypothetical protein HUU49_05180 [Candidatus Buchananbacteria bacterium]|nr:hypothetical protein [Candidatus Buchananbacteria bacterium]